MKQENQIDLFDGFEPVDKYQRHSETSKDAARDIESSASTLRAKVYQFLSASGGYGATDEELQIALEMNPSTQRPRRVELVEKGLVRDSGKVRKTRSNRNAVVWVVIAQSDYKGVNHDRD
jgi:hypothetical protein